METTYYAIVQTVDGETRAIGYDNRLYTSLEEANKEYMRVCNVWYKEVAKEPVVGSWMKNYPKLMCLSGHLLSPNPSHVDPVIQELRTFYSKYTKQIEDIVKNTQQEKERLMSQVEEEFNAKLERLLCHVE